MGNKTDRFDILRQLAIAGSRGEDLTHVSQVALDQAAQLIGLSAAALYLWDEKLNTTVTVAHAASDASRKLLQSLEEDLYSNLRKEKALVSAYMSFGGDKPCHSFTQPLRYGSRIFGAVIGLQEGDRPLVSQDVFLEALSALLALNYAAGGVSETAELSQAERDKQQQTGIHMTAVTVNHEINSPLTAILGNVQLLLRGRDNLDDNLVTKLQIIEESAERIQKVTRKLLQVKTPRPIEYSEGITMLGLPEDDED